MKRRRNLSLLLVVFVVLLGGLLYLNKHPKKEADTGAKDEKIELSKFDSKKIKKMVLASGKETLSLEKQGDKWVANSTPAIQLNQTNVNNIAGSFSNLYAERLIDKNPGDLTQFGLKPSASTAKVVLEDGTEKAFYIGNQAAGGSLYYFMVENKPEVYAISSSDGVHLSYLLSDVRDTSLTKLNANEISYIKLVRQNEKTIEISTNQNRTVQDIQNGLKQLVMTQPYGGAQDVDDQKIQSLVNDVTGFAIEGFVEDDAKDLSKYGLDKPSMELVMKDKQNTLHLYFGKDKDENSVYFKTDNSKSVYTISKSKLDSLKVTPFDLASKSAYITDIDSVDKIVVEANNKTDVITLERHTEKPEKEGEAGKVVTNYKLNDKQLEETPFKTYYQALIGLTVDGENDKQVGNTAEVKTTLYLNSGVNRQVTISYVPYNADFYAVVRDGKPEFVISKQKVQAMLNTLEQLRNGQLKSQQ